MLSMSPQLNATDFTNGTAGSFTFSMWVKSDSLSTYRDKWVQRSYWNFVQIEIRAAYARYVHHTDGSSYQSLYCSKELSADTWYHYAVSVNTGTGEMRGYIDGEFLGSLTHSNMEVSLWSGAAGGFNTVSYVGKFDEVSIWDGVLSDGQVEALYGGGDAADLSSLDNYSDCVEWWRFDNDEYDGTGDLITGEKGHDTSFNNDVLNPNLLTTDVPSS
jgi:hypothetical protein